MATHPVHTNFAAPATPAAGADLAAQLREWDDEHLARLLGLRPDLATPPPSSITALAARAGSRASVTRALGEVKRPALVVAEALAVLGSRDDPVGLDALALALGLMPDGAARADGAAGPDDGSAIHDAVQQLRDRALVFSAHEGLWLVEAARDVLADQPLGLGPSLQALGLDAAEGWPTTPAAGHDVLADAPEGARRAVEALMWGPPVGSFERVPPAVRWLLQARVLHRLSATQVVLPREVGLALRGGRLVREVPLRAPLPEVPVRDDATVAAESAHAGEQILREIDVLVRAWSQEPAPVLRTGGLGVREVKRVAEMVDGDPSRAALVVELAGMLGLLGQHMSADGTVWAPTAAALDDEPPPMPQRWAALASTWLDSARTPWLVGTRTDKGALRAALATDLQRSWAPRLRRRVLGALAAWPVGSAPSAEEVQEHLAWHTPRSAPPVETVAAVLAEAEALGLTGAGALSSAGQTLAQATSDAANAAVHATVATAAGAHAPMVGDEGDPTLTTVTEAFAADLPPAVADLFIQGDLTGVVPGRPDPGLASVLEQVAVIESRGSALTVRFTADSLRGALDAGWSDEQILERLRTYSRTPLPQPLEYLVSDTARHHGHLRVGRARSFLRAEEEGALAALLGDSELDGLGLQLLAPTVAIAQVGPQELLDALHGAGYSALAETLDGQVVSMQPRQVRATHPMPAPPVSATAAQDSRTLDEAIAQMRAGEEQVAGNGHSTDPVYALELLRRAAQGGQDVELVIAGSAGAAQRHRVRPLSVAGGRVRVLDVGRQTELTVAAHRIVSVGTS